MKRTIAIMIIAVTIFLLSSCGNKNNLEINFQNALPITTSYASISAIHYKANWVDKSKKVFDIEWDFTCKALQDIPYDVPVVYYYLTDHNNFLLTKTQLYYNPSLAENGVIKEGSVFHVFIIDTIDGRVHKGPYSFTAVAPSFQ
jgi:hypothetical protein